VDKLVIHPTEMAQWHALVDEAQKTATIRLGEELESYLVLLLMRYIGKPDVVGSIVALDFLHSAMTVGSERRGILQEVGDKCLLFAGLFPGVAEKRRVRVSYFVDIGQSAYHSLGHLSQEALKKLFDEICEGFVPMMDVLQATREISTAIPTLTPLQAEELWNDTGSQRAFETLKRYTKAMPVKHDFKEVH